MSLGLGVLATFLFFLPGLISAFYISDQSRLARKPDLSSSSLRVTTSIGVLALTWHAAGLILVMLNQWVIDQGIVAVNWNANYFGLAFTKRFQAESWLQDIAQPTITYVFWLLLGPIGLGKFLSQSQTGAKLLASRQPQSEQSNWFDDLLLYESAADENYITAFVILKPETASTRYGYVGPLSSINFDINFEVVSVVLDQAEAVLLKNGVLKTIEEAELVSNLVVSGAETSLLWFTTSIMSPMEDEEVAAD